MQSHPQLIRSYLEPLCKALCPFNYAPLYRISRVVSQVGSAPLTQLRHGTVDSGIFEASTKSKCSVRNGRS
jgi:hypothetical protein